MTPQGGRCSRGVGLDPAGRDRRALASDRLETGRDPCLARAPNGDGDRAAGEAGLPRAVPARRPRSARSSTRTVFATSRRSPARPVGAFPARITSKGQVTIPKSVREALHLGEGDQVVFRVIEGERAILARTPDLLELAGSVPVPAGVRGLEWDEVRRRAWAGQLRG
ncbi:MAG TPA: AbrB/MazE/SpoVT family DNA-binding domain-containing protein [Gaiellaceae bacterium]|nr:AbrB/MazE/SpoVT family DNA-binding domain-containing protein [Gaiellaceae bacterium]